MFIYCYFFFGLVIVVFGFMNIGKIYYVLEWMLGYELGMIGFFLCFFVCEVYDKVVDVKGLGVVVLIIGEEKIFFWVLKYYVCIVEVMLFSIFVVFVVVDEI